MKIESIKNVNITGLFSVPLDHLLISPDKIVSLFNTGTNPVDIKKSVIEAPGLKVIVFPELKKEFIFENVRVLVSDRGEVTPENTTVIDDFKKLIDNNIFDSKKLTAFGFNFDAIVIPDSTFSVSDLIGTKLSKFPNIQNAGVNIVFDKDGLKYNFALAPLGVENKYLAHFNVHIQQDFPDVTEVKRQLLAQYAEFNDVILKI